ncbi:MAG TPA: M1 family metallopeptidase [Gemmatimonadaceae bacterium]|nr:M1 family metallopeptidase [Gemmatimonadaceae bacterium]
MRSTIRAVLLLLAATPLAAQQPRSDAPRPGIDVLHYDLGIDLPDTGATINARAVLTVMRTARADSLRLDLIGLHVDSVLVDRRPVRFGRDSANIFIPLPHGEHDTVHVAVRYGGVATDGLIIRHDSLGRWTAFGDNWPTRARYWIPSVDSPDDKATVTWTVTAPANRTVVANGELVEEAPLPPVAMAAAGSTSGVSGSPRTRTIWREQRPIPTYTMVIAAAPLAYYDLGRSACGHSRFPGCVRQAVYVAPEVVDFLPGPFAQADDIVNYYASLVGPFPYEKLSHLESSTRFGGMENATAIFYADRPFRRHTMRAGVIAHETAHQWFGDAVTEVNFAHLWLSEGFATYFAALWMRHAQGDSAFRAEMARTRRQIIASSVTAERPVIDTAQTNYLKLLNTNSYQKGGWVLHMLRGLVGDSAFFHALRGYYNRYHGGNATTDDLRHEMERASGQSLGWFFSEWLRRPGYAELTTSWRYDTARKRVVVEIAQGTRFAPYRFPLTVAVRTSTGAVRRVTVRVAARRSQEVTLPIALTAKPRGLTFDPDVQLLAAITSR